jgi:hypothetical protein
MLKFDATFYKSVHLFNSYYFKNMKILLIISVLIVVNLILLTFSVNKRTDP